MHIKFGFNQMYLLLFWDHYGWEFEEKGSIFIQTFCDMLQTNSDGKMDFETIKVRANGEILEKSGVMPTSHTTLTSRLFLAASR